MAIQTVCYSVGSVSLQQINQITPAQDHVCKHSRAITFVMECGVDVRTYVGVRWTHALYYTSIYRVLL